jgi:galactokinase
MPSAPTDRLSPAKSLTEQFRQVHGAGPRIFRAPGRVNLIGEHTDYNDGFVMPAAIDFSTWVAVSRSDEPRLKVESTQFADGDEWPLDRLAGPPRKHWTDYVRGVAAVLQGAGYPLPGANLIIDGEVPLGAGLSSSAALEVSSALALLSVANHEAPKLELVQLCQRAEHEYAGTRCGIMDQFIATFGKAEHALMLDCRSLEYELLPLPDDVRLVICNSMVKHELAGGEYNRRRADCETGVRILRQSLPTVRALRDVSLTDLEIHRNDMSDIVYRRCRHVITENQRVLDAAEALKSGNLARFGELMYASHHSLRDDYEVSCRELDLLVKLAQEHEGVYGARMTGGGFGGCTINLARADSADQFKQDLAEAYAKETGKVAEVYVCSAAEGADEWKR